LQLEFGRQALIQAMNDECLCTGLDEAALRRTLEAELGRPDWVDLVQERCPDVFAARPVFIADAHLQRMAAVVRAVESRAEPLRRIAIVDDRPHEQYLHPEFLLFQRLFERHGVQAVIADP
jgi:hypothetical protein